MRHELSFAELARAAAKETAEILGLARAKERYSYSVEFEVDPSAGDRPVRCFVTLTEK